jgi:hypothetical protein
MKLALSSRSWQADYIRIFNLIEEFYTESLQWDEAPSAVITGQSGVGDYHTSRHFDLPLTLSTGKSVWIYYALRRCLAEKRPFVWHYKMSYFLFSIEGVHELTGKFQHASFKNCVWTFCDSDQTKNIPPELVCQDTRFFVIFVTSPKYERWSHMDKTTTRNVIVMNPWKRKEIHRA